MPANRVSPGIDAYFTDVQEVRDLFREIVVAFTLPKRILMIHGMGGVGKSSLLQMFILQCKNLKLPVGLVSLDKDRASSALDILKKWGKDLKEEKITLSKFYKAVRIYDKAKSNASDRRNKIVEVTGKFFSKTLEAYAGNLGSPEIGALGGAIVGTTAEEIVSFISSSLKKPEIDVLNNPQGVLTDDFIADINKSAKKKRIVLIIDSYEKITSLDLWLSDFANSIDSNILLVIVGQKQINWKNQHWERLLFDSHIEKLKPLPKKFMYELVFRYYQSQVGQEPEAKLAKAIAEFSRGLPIAAKISVLLSVQYSVQEFRAIKPRVLDDLLDYIFSTVPNQVASTLEAAAVLRWFDKKMLAALTKHPISTDTYTILRNLESIDYVFKGKTNSEILQLHGSIRELIGERLQVQDVEKYKELHSRAVAYYKKLLGDTENNEQKRDERELAFLELIYHLIQSDKESDAIKESRRAIDEAYGYCRRLFAESIVRILDQYIQLENSRRWLVFLKWFSIKLSPDINEQKNAVKDVIELLAKPDLDQSLRAAVVTLLADLPQDILEISRNKRTVLLEDAVRNLSLSEEEVAKGHLFLGGVRREGADWNASIEDYTEAHQSYFRHEDIFGIVNSSDALAYTYLLMGKWDNALAYAKNNLSLSRELGGYRITTALKTLGWIFTYRGDLADALKCINEAIDISKKRNDEAETIRLTRRLAEIYDRQNLWERSNALYKEFIQKDQELGRVVSMSSYLALLGISYYKQGLLKKAKETLIRSLDKIDKHNEPIARIGLGNVALAEMDIKTAKQQFEYAMVISKDRPYYETHVLYGLMQVEYYEGASTVVAALSKKVDALATEFRYYDILAKTRLFQAYVYWNREIKNLNNDLENIFQYYQDALVYALLYNPILLNDILSGSTKENENKAIISCCLNQAERGRRILVSLRDWWRTGLINTEIFPNQAGFKSKKVRLIQAEQTVLQREFEKGINQKTIIEQIELAL